MWFFLKIIDKHGIRKAVCIFPKIKIQEMKICYKIAEFRSKIQHLKRQSYRMLTFWCDVSTAKILQNGTGTPPSRSQPAILYIYHNCNINNYDKYIKLLVGIARGSVHPPHDPNQNQRILLESLIRCCSTFPNMESTWSCKDRIWDSILLQSHLRCQRILLENLIRCFSTTSNMESTCSCRGRIWGSILLDSHLRCYPRARN